MKYGIAAVVGLLYLFVAAWVVRDEGEAYRRSLREARSTAARKSDTPVLARTADHNAAAKATANGAKPDLPANVAARGQAASANTAIADKPTEVPSKSLAFTKPAPAARVDVPAKGAVASAGPMVDGAEKQSAPPVDLGVVWADSLDLSKLSLEDERRLGVELHRVIMTYNSALIDAELERRVEEAAEPLLKLRARKEMPYTITLLDSPAVNAFSHPGGHIYLSRGLFTLIGEDEDYALQFVIGDEVAHLDSGHAVKCVAAANRKEKEKGLGTLAQFYLLVALGYPDAMEFEADLWVVNRMMVNLDRSRHDTLAFLRKLEGYATLSGFAKGRQLPSIPQGNANPPPPSLVENHFRALTAARRRLSELKTISTTLTSRADVPSK